MSCARGCGQQCFRNPCGAACRPGCTSRGENRPGLDALAYGDGWYGAVLGRMRERLSGDDLPALAALSARATDGSLDPAMALLDGWACVSEVLSFYNERAVNESYLRTCTLRPSAVEIARLVGYAPRPGVAADAWLAFTLDDLDRDAVLEIPAGTRAYTQPAPGETMQPFETVEPLIGRPRWSHMRTRLTFPQWLMPEKAKRNPKGVQDPWGGGPDRQDVTSDDVYLWFGGVTTGLAAGDVLLFDFGREHYGRTVATVEPIPAGAESDFGRSMENRTRVLLQPRTQFKPAAVVQAPITSDVMAELIKSPGNYSTSANNLSLDPTEVFAGDSYAPAAVLATAYPQLGGTLADAIGGTTPKGATGNATVYAMRVQAAIHGHNAPLIPEIVEGGIVDSYKEWNIDGTDAAGEPGKPEEPVGPSEPGSIGEAGEAPAPHGLLDPATTIPLKSNEIALDAVYRGILPGSQVAIIIPARNDETDGKVRPLEVESGRVFTVFEVRTESRNAFNFPAKVTVLTLDRDWRPDDATDFSAIRNSVVFAQSEALELADYPIRRAVAGQHIVLDDYYPGLQPGRRLIVSGEREDLQGVFGVRSSELTMVSAVSHRTLPDSAWSTRDTVHTYLTLAAPGLRYKYRRNSVTIYGNVAHATHGESRTEVLGSGDASQSMQEFGIRQPPLTYVPAPTPEGIVSTLEVRVNELRWQEAPNAAAVKAGERSYTLRMRDDARTAVVTGLGARLPTGRENVRAAYRSGIGRVGNVQQGQVSVLASQPNGVMGVTNPMDTSGGADRDDLAHIRVRAPIGLSALDRLVSATDLEDFARNFAGIGKAKVWWSDPNGRPVPTRDPAANRIVLTIAGQDDAPLGTDSALLRNLSAALALAGDLDEMPDGILKTRNQPSLTVAIQFRNAYLIALRARVRLEADHSWQAVLPRIRLALASQLGFDARDIGQDLDPGIAIAAIQRTRGVVAVDLQGFGTIDTGFPTASGVAPPALPLADIADKARAALQEIRQIPPVTPVAGNTIAYIAPAATGTLLLTPWERG